MNIKVYRIVEISILLTIFLSSFTFSQNQPKAWYVYKYATGLNNGTSWTNAWTSFTSVSWSSMQDGDTLYVSGGTDSLVYNESIGSVGRSNITITRGKSAGHNGKPIIKAPTTGSGTGVQVLSKSNVRIEKLEFQNWQTTCYLNGTINKFYFNNNRIHAYGGFITTGGGRDTTGPKQNLWITNNYITTATSTTDQCEFSLYGTKNVYMIGNVIINSNNNPTPHDDFVQGDGGTNHYFINNYWQFDTTVQKEGNANGLSAISNHGGDWVAVNNIFVKNNWQINGNINHFYRPRVSPTLWFRNWAKVLVVGNTSLMYTGRHFVIDYDTTAVIKNNILWVPGQFHNGIGTGASDFIRSDMADGTPHHTVQYYDIKNNAFFNSYPNISMTYLNGGNVPSMHPSNIFIESTNVSPDFVSFSYGNKDPQQFRLKSTSLCRDAGASNIIFTMHPDNDPAALNYLGSGENLVNYYLKRDFNGNLRDASWDIGAFEYNDGQVNQDNDPPYILDAVIIDSVTININFSEPLDQSSALNPGNFTIDNGITVNSAQFINNSALKLNTTIHAPGFYTITVNNITDTAGNMISPSNNSAVYGYNPDPFPGLLKFTPTGTNASSIPEPDHLPEKTFDGLGYNSGDPTSRWAGNNLPQWIGYDLGNSVMLNKTRIQFYKWNEGRIYNYSIMVSTDSINWTTVKQNILSSNTEWTEENFEPISARYVRIVVHSNNQNNWASLWETEFYGQLIVSGNEDNNKIPNNFALEQNYPNPFNPVTKIRYTIPGNVEARRGVSLRVYDILGNEVATLVDEYKEPGIYEVEFDASDLASGVYIYRLQADRYLNTRKMILLR